MGQTYLQSIQSALRHALETDTRVLLIGEDLLDPYGGAFKVSKGLSTDFPDRVIATPISEGGFTGMATGMALRGLRPVVEIMFGDFLTLCTDQIVNHMTKFRGMYNGKVRVPVVIRTPMGGGRGYGATHSQSIEKMFLGLPELRVVAPSHAHKPGELLSYSILESDSPTLFVEHKLLYPLNLAQTDTILTVTSVEEIPGCPTALVSNCIDAPDVTIISYGGTSRLILPLLQRMKDEEIGILAVFPSSLKPVPIATLSDAAARSGRVVLVEEGTAGFNWGSEVASQLYERLFGKLLRPISRLASREAVIPAAQRLEDDQLVSPDDIEAAVIEVLQ